LSALFISDLHLSGERPKLIELFLKFLRLEAEKAEKLYILGDLFEVWTGDDYILPELEPVLSALKQLTSGGTPVFIMHGNRDFTIGAKFEEMTGCKLLDDPTTIDLNGTKTLISHGDLLCTDDIEYQKFRAKVRNPQWIQQALSLPLEERLLLAKSIRTDTSEKSRLKPEEIMDVNQTAVKEMMEKWNVRQLIHGHTHRPEQHKISIDNAPATRIVLGDWYNSGNVLYCNGDSCTLKEYH